MSLLTLLDATLIGRADRPAVTAETPDGGVVTRTFGDLEHRSNALAAALTARGIVAGDRLGVFLANRIEFVDLWLATVKLGVIAVPTNVLYRERELTHIVADSAPRAVITTPDLAGFLPSGTTVWDLDTLCAEADQHHGAPRPVATLGDRTPAALIYTSGTTGAAKGAVLTHGNFAANARTIVEAWRISADDRFLCTLPLFHVHGLGNGIHAWLATGCHMHLTTRFEASRAESWFLEYQPTLFFGVPTMYVRLLDLPPESARRIGARARLFVSGSAPLPPHVLEAFRERFGHVILERYGMTETLMIAGNPYDGERRAGTVGPALPGVRIRMRDDAGLDVPDGEAGEVWMQGANLCDGYWRRPDATAAAFQDGWFRTGDLGVRSADGYLTLQGRRSELIISGGFNIYPREIEELLLDTAGIREATVVGATDPVRGEVPVAYLVSDAPLDTAALEARLRAQLASFKLPRAFIRVDALPRTALGKVQKHLLPPWTP